MMNDTTSVPLQKKSIYPVVVDDNEELDPPPPQDISNVFAAADLLSCSSSDLAKYNRAWIKAEVLRSSIFMLGNFQTHAVDHYNCTES